MKPALAKTRQHSLRAIPIYAVLTVVAGLVVLLVPTWWSWTILAVTGLTLLGDVLSVWISTRKLADSVERADGADGASRRGPH
jgi:hypothetical protein